MLRHALTDTVALIRAEVDDVIDQLGESRADYNVIFFGSGCILTIQRKDYREVPRVLIQNLNKRLQIPN